MTSCDEDVPSPATPKAKRDPRKVSTPPKLARPTSLPAGVKPSAKRVPWLPCNWLQGVKTTRSGNQLCFVNPQGKLFYHKAEIEKSLGYMLSQSIGPTKRKFEHIDDKHCDNDSTNGTPTKRSKGSLGSNGKPKAKAKATAKAKAKARLLTQEREERIAKARYLRGPFMPLTTEQLASLSSSAGNWADGFESFLKDSVSSILWFGKTCSPENVHKCIKQIKKLASGAGVKHPRADATFSAGRPLRLTENIERLRYEAVDFLSKYGEDESHGWLLIHPLTKALAYQRHLVTGGSPEKLIEE